jgi:PIN domain nuclease of toxin-antitoxin system
VKLLLDTHAFVWAAMEPGRLGPRIRALLVDQDNQVVVSAASAYEIEFKRPRDAALMRMPLDLGEVVAGMEFTWLAVTPRHATVAGRLPRLHGDPFDRILAAQALEENAALVTADSRMPSYGVTVLW